MTIKTFLPMGEKPPDIIGQGNNATIKQAPTVISFPPSQQFPEEFLVLELLTLCSIAFSLIVIILSPVSLASNFALVPPMHYPTTYPHWNPTTIITSSNTTTKITTINTTTIITVNAPKTHAIDIIPDSSARPVNILSFTSATVATPPTTAAPATAEIYLHSTSLFIVIHFAASNITSRATAADDATPIPVHTPTDAVGNIYFTADNITTATNDSTTSTRLLYAIHLAAARASTADADDTSATTTRLLLAIHLVAAKDTKDTSAACGESAPADHLIIDTPDPHYNIAAVSTATTTTYHHLYSFHVATIIHGNTYLLHHSVLLLLPVAAWTARYSAPSSIYDEVLAILVQPSSTLWRIIRYILQFSYPRQHHSEPF